MDHPEEELKDVITRRLLDSTEENFGDEFVERALLADSGGENSFEVGERPPSEVGVEMQAVAAAPQVRPTTFTKIEKSLASLGFFTPSSRRLKNYKIKKIRFTREVEGKRVEVTAEIIPSAVFGLPVTADQDKYLALQKIITNAIQSDGKLSNPIRFKSADLLRLLDRSTKTGKNYKDISEWLDVMSSTTIFSNGVVYVAGQKRFARDRFRVFDRAISVGKELDDGTLADANYVWLSSWQLENINHNYLLPIDLETYRQLKNHIAKALVPLLQIWLFASHRAGSFEKRYDELCEILTLQTYRAPSHILRQFKPSLDELTQHGYLEKWRIEKTTDRKAYKLVFFHGPKFHRDRRKRLEQKNQATSPPVIVAESDSPEPNLPEPGHLNHSTLPASATQPPIGAAATRREGESLDLEARFVDALSGRGLVPSTALKLIRSIPADRLSGIGDYIDYWDDIKKNKNVGEGLLYRLIEQGRPLPANFETRRNREGREAAEDKERKLFQAKEALTARYKEYSSKAAADFMAATVSPDEFDRRVASRKDELTNDAGMEHVAPKLVDSMVRSQIRAEIAREANILSFEDFRQRALPHLLIDFELSPADFGLEVLATTSNGAAHSHPNALYPTTAAVSPQNEGTPIPGENSSPRAI